MARLETLPTELLRLIADFVVANAIPNNIETKGPFRWAYCDLAALALTNRQFNRIFEPLLYRWDEQQDECHSISWAVQSDEMGTLERALASKFDFNRTLHTLSARQDHPGYNDVIVGISLGTDADHILKWLLEHGTKPEPFEPRRLETLPHPASYEKESPLFQSFGFCHNQEAALILLKWGARPFFIQPDGTSYKHALGEAARAGFERVVEQLLHDGTFQWSSPDGRGYTALDHAVKATFSNTAVIEVLLRYRASDAQREEPVVGNAMFPGDLRDGLIEQAFRGGHVDNVAALLRHISEHDPGFCSHKALWSWLGLLDTRMFLMPGVSVIRVEDCEFIISKLIELGADFNNPPPPHQFSKHGEVPLVALAAINLSPYVLMGLLNVGVDPMIKLRGNRALFDVIWEDHLDHGPSRSELKVAALLRAGARMDLKDPVTGRTAFETAMEMADDDSEPDCEPLQFLLDQATVSTWASDYILEVLDEQLDNMEEHLFSAILSMQHGWISKKARSYVFRWLVHYLGPAPAEDSGLYLDHEDWGHNSKAVRFFPRFLTRRQLDALWDEGLKVSMAIQDSCERGSLVDAFHLQERWNTMPWIEISAQRGDTEAMEVLAKHDHPITDTTLDEEEEALSIMARNAGGYSPLMLAIAAGHRDMAFWFIQPADYPSDLACRHPETYFYDETDDDEDDDHDDDRGHDDIGLIENIIPRLKRKADHLCRTCPYGQRSAFEIAVHRGELEIFEAMWDLELKDLAWKVYLDVPRVYSYGSAMLEWMQLRLGMKTWMKLEMSGQDAWLRDEIQKKLQILRTEVIQIREAWRARAKILEEKWMNLQEEETGQQMDTDSANSPGGDQ